MTLGRPEAEDLQSMAQGRLFGSLRIVHLSQEDQGVQTVAAILCPLLALTQAKMNIYLNIVSYYCIISYHLILYCMVLYHMQSGENEAPFQRRLKGPVFGPDASVGDEPHGATCFTSFRGSFP